MLTPTTIENNVVPEILIQRINSSNIDISNFIEKSKDIEITHEKEKNNDVFSIISNITAKEFATISSLNEDEDKSVTEISTPTEGNSSSVSKKSIKVLEQLDISSPIRVTNKTTDDYMSQNSKQNDNKKKIIIETLSLKNGDTNIASDTEPLGLSSFSYKDEDFSSHNIFTYGNLVTKKISVDSKKSDLDEKVNYSTTTSERHNTSARIMEDNTSIKPENDVQSSNLRDDTGFPLNSSLDETDDMLQGQNQPTNREKKFKEGIF